MLNFKRFLEDQEYAGPGTMMDNQGIPRQLMKHILSGDVFIIGDEGSGQIKLNGKVFSVPLPAKIDTTDGNFHVDKSGNFLRGTMIIMANDLPTQDNKIGKETPDGMIQNPQHVGQEKIVINAKQLKDLLTTGLQQSAQQAAMGGMGGGMGMGGIGGF